MAVVENADGSDLAIDVGSTSRIPDPANGKAAGPTLRPHQESAVAERSSNGGIHGEMEEEDEEGEGDKEEAEVKQLQELLSKLNPMAKEFVPPSLVGNGNGNGGSGFGFYANASGMQDGFVAFQNGGGVGRSGSRRVI